MKFGAGRHFSISSSKFNKLILSQTNNKSNTLLNHGATSEIFRPRRISLWLRTHLAFYSQTIARAPCQNRTDVFALSRIFCRMSRRRDLNPRPTHYKCVALPLSYVGIFYLILYSSINERIAFNNFLSE